MQNKINILEYGEYGKKLSNEKYLLYRMDEAFKNIE